MAKLVVGACIGAGAYVLFRQGRDEPLEYDFTPPPPVRPAHEAAKPLPAQQRPVQQTPESDTAAVSTPATQHGVTAAFFRTVMWQIFVSVLVVLAIAQWYGAERGRTVAIGVAGVFGVFFTWALAQMQLQGRKQRRQGVVIRQPARSSSREIRAGALSAVEEAEALIAAMGGAKPPPPPQDLSGTWDKDRLMSDSMEPVMNTMRLNSLVRKAVGTAKGVRIRMDGDHFEMSVLSSILWFKVTERYPWSGEERRYKRRDLRRGHHFASACVTQQGHVRLKLRWEDPLGGTGSDVFHSPAAGLLHVDSTLHMKSGEIVSWRQVYRKRA